MYLPYWQPSIGLAVLCFYSKTGFWPSYCQISADLDKILYTPIVVRNTLAGWFRPRSARGRLQSKPEQLCFFSVILVTHPKSYNVETTDRRDFRGKPSKWMRGRVLSWKIPEFCSMGAARSKNSIFPRFMVPFDCPVHSLQETVLPQTNGTDGKPRLWRCAFC